MTVTQNRQDANMQQTEQWKLDRVVEIERGCHTSFGFSIVSGKIDVENQNMNVGVQQNSGVFVKSIAPDSCASDLVNLKIGDHIVEIDGINIRNSSYEHATQIIQKAGNILRLRVQSLNCQDNSCYLELPETQPELEKRIVTEEPLEMNRRASLNIEHDTEFQQVSSDHGNPPILEDNVKTGNFEHEDDVKHSDSDESSDSEDERYLEGNIFTKAGIELGNNTNIMEFLLVILRSGKTAVVPASSLRTAGKFQKVKWENGHLYLVRVLAKSNNQEVLQNLHVDGSGIINFVEESLPEGKEVRNPYIPADDSEQECLNEASQTPGNAWEKPSCFRISSSAELPFPQESIIDASHSMKTSEWCVQKDVLSTDTKKYQISVKMIDVAVGRDVVSTVSRGTQCSVGTLYADVGAAVPSTVSRGSQYSVEKLDVGVGVDAPFTVSSSSQCSVRMINESIGPATENDQSHDVSHGGQPLMPFLDGNESSGSGINDDNGVRIDHERNAENPINVNEWVHDGAAAVQSCGADLPARNEDNKAELVLGCNVFAPTDELLSTLATCQDNPRELIRRLIKLVLPKEVLLKMTVTGGGRDRRPIPERILLAVENCMRQNVVEELWLSASEIHRVLGKMLDKMRESQRHECR